MSVTVSRHPLLNREEQVYPYGSFTGHTVAITGGDGSIGTALREGRRWSSLDVESGTDILDYDYLVKRLAALKIDTVIHAAANKHAPEGELHPYDVADLNVRGTQNVVEACREVGIKRLVFVSTCKAAQPETVYGASKLVGERIVLNAGYTVARLYNVVESSRNVFDIWEKAAASGEIGAASCRRFFITLDEAVSFILSCVDRKPGRYVPDALPHNIEVIARRWANQHPGVKVAMIPPRRGDRQVEPMWANYERGYKQPDRAWRVVSPHDHLPLLEEDAA